MPVYAMIAMRAQLHAANANYGPIVKARRGDNSVLLGFNLEDHLADREPWCSGRLL
jgi:hypothetical protein